MVNVSKDIVNTSEVRASALPNFLLLGSAIFLDVIGSSILLSLLLSYLIIGFFAAGWAMPLKSNVYIYKKLKRIFGKGYFEPSLPVRFSSKIGFSITLIALFLNIANSYSIIFIVLCFIASSLNAFTGYCIACKLYPRYRLFVHYFSTSRWGRN